ncbi:MAG TPA: DUF5615 family PIN-like protein [Chitinophagaceae bacterium]|nr:DUF5615 family PIN-like protein [Chitinophagaceae bacterium]
MQLDWEIWLDNQISSIIAKWMMDETGWTVKSSYTLQLHFKSDLQIYNEAKAAGKVIIISKDSDLPQIITRLGAPPKLINIKIGNCHNRVLWNFIRNRLYKAIEELQKEYISIVDLEP